MKIPDTFTVDTDRLLRNANLNASHGGLELRRRGTLIQLVIRVVFAKTKSLFSSSVSATLVTYIAQLG